MSMLSPSLQSVLEIITLLAESEQAIARLYRSFAETLKEDEAFWLYLEREELGHEKNLEAMAEMIRQNPAQFQLKRPFNTAAVRTFMAGIEQNIEGQKNEAFPRRKALIIARDIESSIIEKTYHEIVQTTNLSYVSLIKQVVAETQLHKNAVEKRLRECVI